MHQALYVHTLIPSCDRIEVQLSVWQPIKFTEAGDEQA
jgi:hypothetical protein